MIQIEFIHFNQIMHKFLESSFLAIPYSPVSPLFCSHDSPTHNLHIYWDSHNSLFLPLFPEMVTNPFLNHCELIETDNTIYKNYRFGLFLKFQVVLILIYI